MGQCRSCEWQHLPVLVYFSQERTVQQFIMIGLHICRNHWIGLMENLPSNMGVSCKLSHHPILWSRELGSVRTCFVRSFPCRLKSQAFEHQKQSPLVWVNLLFVCTQVSAQQCCRLERTVFLPTGSFPSRNKPFLATFDYWSLKLTTNSEVVSSDLPNNSCLSHFNSLMKFPTCQVRAVRFYHSCSPPPPPPPHPPPPSPPPPSPPASPPPPLHPLPCSLPPCQLFAKLFANFRTQWALLDLNCKGLSALGTAGPQPGTFRAQWAPLDLNLGPSELTKHRWTSTWDPPSSVSTAGPQRPDRMPEDMPDRMPDRMPERMPKESKRYAR